jgi:Lar family restriction alleviation protein
MTKRLEEVRAEVRKRMRNAVSQCELFYQGVPFEEYVDALLEQGLIDRGFIEELLRPCPFCGRNNSSISPPITRVIGPTWYVHCPCGATGANGRNRVEATLEWNKRARCG